MTAGAGLPNLEAYDHWAPCYPPQPHNPLMRAEQRAMLEQWPGVSGARALDLACGTGRYGSVLSATGAAEITSLDFSPEMLRLSSSPRRVRADMTRLPFAAASFDIVVSGLAVGHAADLQQWMNEVARVLAPGGSLLYSDFHPDAAATGMTRSFVDDEQRRRSVSHFSHTLKDQRRAAHNAGLNIAAVRELRVGYELREGFAGSALFYRRWHGLPVVLVIRARKGGA
jgi:ubiquinone/menaquinone biosynthesis C-methylase UbiE